MVSRGVYAHTPSIVVVDYMCSIVFLLKVPSSPDLALLSKTATHDEVQRKSGFARFPFSVFRFPQPFMLSYAIMTAAVWVLANIAWNIHPPIATTACRNVSLQVLIHKPLY